MNQQKNNNSFKEIFSSKKTLEETKNEIICFLQDKLIQTTIHGKSETFLIISSKFRYLNNDLILDCYKFSDCQRHTLFTKDLSVPKIFKLLLKEEYIILNIHITPHNDFLGRIETNYYQIISE